MIAELSKSYSIRSLLRFRFGVLEIAIVAWLIAIVVKAGLIRIDDRLPLAVEADGLAAVGICDQINLLCLRTRDKRESEILQE